MNAETTSPFPAAPRSGQSEAGNATVPVWLIVMMFLLLYWGAIYFDKSAGLLNAKVYMPYESFDQLAGYAPETGKVNLVRGERLFNSACSICHGTDGLGKPGLAPPLAGSDWVKAAGVNRLIRIPVLGITGPIEVNGKQYNFASGGMTAVAPNPTTRATTFPDDSLADILSYVRHAWGNNMPEVTIEDVKAVRDQIGERTKQLTLEELKQLPEKR